MEVLLLQDIPGVGKKNDLLVVRDGYALNCLLPNRMALVATPTVRKRYADQIKRRAEEKVREQAFRQSAVAQLSGKHVTLKRKATKTGKLYAAVAAKAITEALAQQHSLQLDPEQIDIEEEIKALGTHEVRAVMGEYRQPFNVVVEAEQ